MISGHVPHQLSVHKDFQPAQTKSSETATSQMADAIGNFTDPCSVKSSTELFCIASGKPAPEDVHQDLLQAQERGQSAMNEFMETRLVDKVVPFHDPLKRLKLHLPLLVSSKRLKVHRIKCSTSKLSAVFLASLLYSP